MRLLRKTGDPYPYAWTEALAARPDMMEVMPAGTGEDPLDDSPPEAMDELDDITTVEGLRKYAAANGVHLSPEARSKAAIRTAIREAAAAAADPLADAE